jgi:hypothetical protein
MVEDNEGNTRDQKDKTGRRIQDASSDFTVPFFVKKGILRLFSSVQNVAQDMMLDGIYDIELR